MTTQEAEKILQQYSSREIAAIYHIAYLQKAIIALMPGFEYPNWSYRRVGEFLRYCARARSGTSVGLLRQPTKFEDRLNESLASAASSIYERNLEAADLDSFLLEDSVPLLKTAIDRTGIAPVLRAVADVCWGKGEIKTDPHHEQWTTVAAKLDNLADDINDIIPHPEYEEKPFRKIFQKAVGPEGESPVQATPEPEPEPEGEW